MRRINLCSLPLTSGLLLGACHPRVVMGPGTLATACIDSGRINPRAACTLDYNPVCGCNGLTYANACVARNAGLLSFRPGPCPGQP